MTELADLAAEADVCGALMLADPAQADDLLAQVRPSAFYRGAHGTVVEAVQALRSGDEPTDATQVARVLRERGQLDAVGGPQELSTLVHQVPSVASAHASAKTVMALAQRRAAEQAGQRLAEQAARLDVDVDDAITATVDELSRTAGGVTATVDGDALLENMLALVESGETMLGYPAPWPHATDTFRIVPGWLHAVYGWPSHGKTAWVNSLLVELAEQHGLRAVVWSPESAPLERHMRDLVAIYTDTAPHRLTPHLAGVPGTWVRDHVTWLDHHHVGTVGQLLAQASAKASRGECDLLVIDPWTKVDMWEGGAKGEAWDRMLQRQLQRLSDWARRTMVPVVIVCHPRNADRHADGTRPRPSNDMLHGGAMYQNFCDSMLGVWRDETREDGSEAVTEVHVHKVKEQPAGGRMGRMVELVRADSGRYRPLSKLQGVPA